MSDSGYRIDELEGRTECNEQELENMSKVLIRLEEKINYIVLLNEKVTELKDGRAAVIKSTLLELSKLLAVVVTTVLTMRVI